MKIGLCLIVKNEAHIIRESMSCTLPLIDTFSIVDTGSTDNTIEVIKDFYKEKGIEGVVHERPWKNFGHNRSESLQLCDGLMDYILVIDADDLMFFPSNGREMLHKILEQEKPNGCCLNIQQGSGMKYMRGQIFKANDGWCYKGVVHEYPTNCKNGCKMINLPPEFWVESRRLGGRNLTGDKMKRDIEALLKGIEEEPDNDRYYFYLAQSYRDDDNNEEAIKYYKKRFKMGRWHEEAWNSAYNVGECYRRIGNMLKFEYWMQKAFEFHKARAEPLYHLIKYYRETNQFYKALHYISIARQLPYPKNDVLFIEQFPNTGGVEYEASIVEYYIHPERSLQTTIKYMLLREEHQQNCISNLKFSVKPIASVISPLNIPLLFGEDFRPSAVSCLEYPWANIRFVNYVIPTQSQYHTKDGSPIQTRNAYVNLDSKEFIIFEDPIPKFDSSVRGLEDLRLYTQNNKKYFTATSYKQFIQDKVSIVHGEYNLDLKTFDNCEGIQSPTNSNCEKNWINVPGTDDFIYSWNPLRIGKIRGNKILFHKEIETPPLFKTFRGSAQPIEINGKLVTLVHFVEYCTPRNYYHCFVELEKETYKVLRVSLPFSFKGLGIEYCLSARLNKENKIECYVSFFDANLHKVEINQNELKWIEISKPSPKVNIPKILFNDSYTTFVTALIDLNESRPDGKALNNYLNHFQNLADTNLSLHVFISSSFEEKFKQRYSNYKNIFYETLNLEDLDVYKELLDVEFSRPSVIIENSKQTTNYNIVQHSKIEFVKRAIDKNKFNNKQFAWIDFGIDYVIKDKNSYKNLFDIKALSDEIVFPTVLQRSLHKSEDFNNINWRFAGGFFIGNKESLINFYNLYRKEFKNIIREKKILTWEVNLWAYFEEFHFLKFKEYKSNHNDLILQLPKEFSKFNSTIVTMYFNLKKLPDSTDSVRPIEFYLEHGKKTLELPYPMVLFCDGETRPLLEKIRGNLPTTYIEKNIIEYDYFKELYPKVVENRKVIPSPDPRNTSSYFLLCMFKFHALHLAKQGNYYPDTSHYFWIDLGGSHVMRGFPNAVYKMLDNPRPRISCGYIHYRPDSELYPMTQFLKGGGPTCMGGTCFSVESEYVQRYYNDIFEILNEQIAIGVGHTDEQCMVYSYSRHPEWFNIYFADYYSLVTNYHKTIEDISNVKKFFIENAKRWGKNDLVELCLLSIND